MAKNDFKPFAIGENSNVLSQAEYEELTALASGFQTGTAFSEQLNKVWRQSSVMSSVLADFVAQQSGDDVLDDSNVVKLKASLLKALLQYSTSQLDPRYLKSASNLSEISNKDIARDNLGVYSKQVSDGKYLQILSNLADVPNKDVSRDNLGVYSKQVSDGKYLQALSNLADVSNKDVARDNLDVYGKSLTDGKYLQIGNELFEVKNKANARYNLGLKSAAVSDVGTSSGTVAAGDDARIVNSLDKRTGGVIAGAVSSTFSDTYRIVGNNIGQFWRMDGVALYLLLTNRADPYGGYNSLRPFAVNVDNGNVSMAHRVDIGTLYTNNSLFVGDTVYQEDGNINASLWGGDLNGFIRGMVNSRATWDYVNSTFVRDVRLGSIEASDAWKGPGYSDQAPYVLTGAYNHNTDEYIDVIYRRPMQKNINGTWYNVVFI